MSEIFQPTSGRPVDAVTGEFVERRQRTGTIADRRDPGSMARKKWARVLNIAFIISTSISLVGPAIASSYLGLAFSTVTSGSMRPGIQPGDVLISKGTQVNQLKTGEIVLAMNTKTWEVQSHRIQSIAPDVNGYKIITKGDANPVADPAFVLGGPTSLHRVVATVPKIGYVLNALATKTARLILLVLFVVINTLLVSNLLVKRRKEDKIHKKDSETNDESLTSSIKKEDYHV